MSGNVERRKYKRCSVKVPLSIVDEVSSVNSYSYDLSVGGVGAYSDKYFSLNSKVYLMMKINDEKEAKAIGTVLRVRDTRVPGGRTNSLGIQFRMMVDDDVRLLKDFLRNSYSRAKIIGMKKLVSNR